MEPELINLDDYEHITPSQSASQVSSRELSIIGKRKAMEFKNIWYHYSKLKGRESQCDYCSELIPKQNNSGTNAHWNHLRFKHNDIYNRAKGIKNRNIQKKIVVKRDVLGLANTEQLFYTKDDFQRSLLNLFVKNSIAFTVMDSEYFQKPFLMLDKDADLFSASTLKRRVMSLYSSMKEQKINELSSIDSKISFTTDCWTSSNNKSFMGLTAHWIDSDFNICATTLDFCSLPLKHTGLNLANKLSEIWSDFGIQHKVLAITLDSAANNDLMLDYIDKDDSNSFSSFAHIRCFAHVVNLGAQDALRVIKDDLEALRVVIKSIRASPQSSKVVSI
jgi:hypothetical protein